MEPRRNNPAKLPTFVLLAAFGVMSTVVGIANGAWLVAIGGVALTVACAFAARVVSQGGNPWWLRSPFDKKRPADPRD